MKMHIQVLWRNMEVLSRLQRDGWEVDASEPDSLSAKHCEVADEAEARCHLHKLGLLTSPAVRISFCETVRHLRGTASTSLRN